MRISRNQPCPCGSTQRFKHCCGGPDRIVGTEADGDLLGLLLEADEAGLVNGENPSQRAFNAPWKVTGRLFPGGVVLMGDGAPAEVRRMHELVKELYRSEDIAVGGIHLGMFMFRDVYARLSVPVMMGTFETDPIDHVDLSPVQKRWLQRRENDLQMLWDQFVDLFDFGYGLIEPKAKLPELAGRFLGLAHFQLQAAAATLTGAARFRAPFSARNSR